MPELDINQKQPRLKSSEQNALHKFASYNCLFTLSGITERELQSQRNLFNSELRDVIARSAGIGPTGSTGTTFRDQEGGNIKNEQGGDD